LRAPRSFDPASRSQCPRSRTTIARSRSRSGPASTSRTIRRSRGNGASWSPDFVYAWKRIFDPRWKSPAYSAITTAQILGTEELRARALKSGSFDYDREIEGLSAPDRYTFRVKLGMSAPRFIYNFSDSSQLGATAREVVEFYGDEMMAHPVGTGPYRLAEWHRSSKIVLERNPGYRNDFYDAEPSADDARSQAILAQLRA
jgi:ABC-type oligopeptide transport system substrate-binding subunit